MIKQLNSYHLTLTIMETVSILNHYKNLCSSFLKESATKLTKSLKVFRGGAHVIFIRIRKKQ